MTETTYLIQSNPERTSEQTSDEIFSQEELGKITLVADNIASVVYVADNGLSISQLVQDNAQAAQASALAAANSAVSAGNSANSAANSATSAANSATSAANSATSAANSATSAQAILDQIQNEQFSSLPPGGDTGTVLRKLSASNYDVGWTEDVLRTTDLLDWDPAVPEQGQVPIWNGSRYAPGNAAGGSQTLSGLQDVSYNGVPTDGQVLGFQTVGEQLLVRNISPDLVDSGQVLYPTPISGPATVSFSSEHVGGKKIVRVDTSSGMVELVFSNEVDHPTGIALVAYFLKTHSGTLRLKPSSAGSSAMPSIITANIALRRACSNVVGTPLSATAMDGSVTFTVPIGNKMAIAVFHSANPASTGDPSHSAGFTWRGIDYDWQTSEAPSTSTPRVFAGVYPLGDLQSELTGSLKLRWTDYGATDNNASAYQLIAVPLSGVDQVNTNDGFIFSSVTDSTNAFNVNYSLDSTKTNRNILTAAFRRSNAPSSTGTAIVSTGHTTQLSEGPASDGQGYNASNLRRLIGAKTGVANNDNTITLTGGLAQPLRAVRVSIRPPDEQMNLYDESGSAPLTQLDITEINKVIGIIYDKHGRAVRVIK